MKTPILIIILLGLVAYSYLCIKGDANNALLIMLPMILIAVLFDDDKE